MTRPRWHNDHRLLSAVARELHRRGHARCRAAVDAGTMTRDAANDAVRILRAIARHWAAIASIEPQPASIDDADAGGAWPFERRAALTAEAATARAAADAAHDDFETVGFADAVATLLWWEDERPSARFLVDATIALRAQAARHRLAANPNPTLFQLGEAA